MIARLLLGLVRAYQLAVSPMLGPRCRFSPTCSAYAATAITVHGAARGSWLAVRRIARCHPFHPGGHDPVPPPAARPAPASATMGIGHDDAHPHEHRPEHRPATRPGPGG